MAPDDEVLQRVTLPDGKTMTLLRWWESDARSHIAIRVGDRPLMSSHDRGSEVALGELVGARLAGVAAPHVLIGGLGLGFTLRAALDVLPAGARVTVAELVPEVVAWNRGEHGALAGRPADDPRVTIETADVAAVIAEHPRTFDAIVLDVDNGPDALVHRANKRLYQKAGLERARGALRGSGAMLAVWSAFPSKTFTKWMADVGFEVAVERAASSDPRGPRYYIWVGLLP